MTPEDWEQAACAGMDTELFFPDADFDVRPPGTPVATHTAKGRLKIASVVAVCQACPIRLGCLEEHLRMESGRPNNGRYGIVGGLTARQRSALDPLLPVHPTPWRARGARNGTCGSPGTKRGVLAHKDGPQCPECVEYVERVAYLAGVRERSDKRILDALAAGLHGPALYAALGVTGRQVRRAQERARSEVAA